MSFSQCPEDEIAKKGASEIFFLRYLLDNFDSVYTDHRVSVGNSYYYPDFIIEEENLTFDIEIDEPYSGNDGKPIHYIDSKYGISLYCIDEERNEWFTSHKWIVIRFAEEQIFKDPQVCVEFIKSFISELKNAEVKSHSDANFLVEKWTKEKAYQYAYQRYRHSYVPKRYQRYMDVEEYNKFELINT